MSGLFEKPLRELKDFEDLSKDLEKKAGPIGASGCMDSQKVHLMYEAAKNAGMKLVVTYDDTRAREIFEDLSYFETPAGSLPPLTDLWITCFH